jgi:hypothetical protein
VTISRVNASGWGVGDKLTSSQGNALDINGTYALDKRAGQTDTLQSVISCSGAGRIVPTFVTAPDANTSFTAGGGNTVIYGAPSSARTYTLSNTGALVGDMITVFVVTAPKITVQDNSSNLLIVLSLVNTSSSWATFIFNGSAWVLMSSAAPSSTVTQTFTSSGTYTVPFGYSAVLLIGCGGGGGGASGHFTSTISTTAASGGGGGGGGALLLTAMATGLTSGGSVSVTIGAGGTGGTGGAAHSAGVDGGDTIFGTSVVFAGAQGGQDPLGCVPGTNEALAYGGACTRLAPRGNAPAYTGNISNGPVPAAGPSVGGAGCWSTTTYLIGNGGATPLSMSSATFIGGNGATTFGTNSTYFGGGVGGGGGAGPFGNGANGGNGGNGGGANGLGGVAGSSAAANSGAGGGGGGAGGKGSSSNGIAGAGGAGGSGQLTIIALR